MPRRTALLTGFNELSAEAYMPGYGDACAYADDNIGENATIYSTYDHVSAPFMVALYYTKTPPKDFLQTVHYKDPDAEFRIADSFTHFKFGLPDDVTETAKEHLEAGDIFILHKTQLDLVGANAENASEQMKVRAFGDFVVISGANP